MSRTDRLTEMLRIAHPVVQAPMLGITTPEMVAAASDAGILGSLAVGGLSADQTRVLIRQTKDLTSKPFAVNLFVYDHPGRVPDGDFNAMQQFLLRFCEANGIGYQAKTQEGLPFYSYRDLLDLLLEEEVPVVSFTFGVPSDDEIRFLQEKGVVLIGTATSVAEAQLLSEKKIDIISVQGMEAGGHRGSFLHPDKLPVVGLMALLPQVAAVTDAPVLAAGGICTRATMDAALAMGADGVQVGSLFLACKESAAPAGYKQAVMRSKAEDTVLTRAFSGRWARGIPNTFSRAVEDAGLSIPPYPIQNVLTAAMRAWAAKHNRAEFLSLWAGQNASVAPALPTADIIRSLMQGE